MVFSNFTTGKEKKIAWSILIIKKKYSYNFHETIKLYRKNLLCNRQYILAVSMNVNWHF